MNRIALSILTPAVRSRFDHLEALCAEIDAQAAQAPVEHLVLLDNKRRTVGEKRDALLRAARGDYVTFLDDDDWIAPDYVSSLLGAQAPLGHEGHKAPQAHGAQAPIGPDVITFLQEANVNGERAVIEFRLGHPNEPFMPAGVVRRNAWHVCAWRRSLAILSHFPATNYGEDWAFAAPLCAIEGLTSVHIPKILYYYRHDSKLTEAPPPGAQRA